MPLFVIGDPVTHNGLTAVAPTLLTVPPPVPGGVAHVPSPRQNVDELAPVPLLRFAGGKLPAMHAPVPKFTVCKSHVPVSAQPG